MASVDEKVNRVLERLPAKGKLLKHTGAQGEGLSLKAVISLVERFL